MISNMFGNRGYNGAGTPQQQPKMDINQVLEQIAQYQRQGLDPNVIMNQLMQKNPSMRIMQQRLNNMAQGRSPQEFITQLARQNNVSPQNMQAIQQMLVYNVK